MGVAFGILLVWLGIAMLWIAFHGVDADTPWGAYQEIIGRIKETA